MGYNAANYLMKISTWKFPTYEDREGAADKIYDNCGGSDAYEKILTTGITLFTSYRIIQMSQPLSSFAADLKA